MSSVFTNSTSSVGQTVQLLEKVVLDSGLKNLVMVGYFKFVLMMRPNLSRYNYSLLSDH